MKSSEGSPRESVLRLLRAVSSLLLFAQLVDSFIGSIHLRARSVQTAQSWFEFGSALPPNISRSKDNLAEIYEEYGGSSTINKRSSGLTLFREYAKRGMKRFREGDLDGAIDDMNNAAATNISQPLQQRAIMLYCSGQFEDAAAQFRNDIALMEHMKVCKAVELRIWLSACLNRMNQKDEAVRVLDADNLLGIPVTMQSALINNTVNFFAGRKPLEEMLELIGVASMDTQRRDMMGTQFFGNFFLGLYFDSIGELGFAQAFLKIPCESNRYPKLDMWYHIPRTLYAQRFPDDQQDTATPDDQAVNTSDDDTCWDSSPDDPDLSDTDDGDSGSERGTVNAAGMIL